MRLGVFIAMFLVVLWIVSTVAPTLRTDAFEPNADQPRPTAVRCLRLVYPSGHRSTVTPTLVVLDTSMRHLYRGHVSYAARYQRLDSTWETWAGWAPTRDSILLGLEDDPYLLAPAGDTLRARHFRPGYESLLEAILDAGDASAAPFAAVWVPCPGHLKSPGA
jgi:hypothetical protein